jgi:hypothetical protein
LTGLCIDPRASSAGPPEPPDDQQFTDGVYRRSLQTEFTDATLRLERSKTGQKLIKTGSKLVKTALSSDGEKKLIENWPKTGQNWSKTGQSLIDGVPVPSPAANAASPPAVRLTSV